MEGRFTIFKKNVFYLTSYHAEKKTNETKDELSVR